MLIFSFIEHGKPLAQAALVISQLLCKIIAEEKVAQISRQRENCYKLLAAPRFYCRQGMFSSHHCATSLRE